MNYIQPRILRPNSPGIISAETLVEPNSPLTVVSRDSFVRSSGEGGGLVENTLISNNLLDKPTKGINDLWKGEFKAYDLNILVGGSTQKVKDITNHLNFLNSGNPSTVTIGFDKSRTEKALENLIGGNSTMPSNLYVITADANGYLTASQPRSGTANNVVGVALTNTDGSIDLIRITGNCKIGLKEGANGTASFSPITQITSGISTTLKTIR